jgi:hypothetical protein
VRALSEHVQLRKRACVVKHVQLRECVYDV